MKESILNKDISLVLFLKQYKAKKRNRRKYVEYIIFDYSITNLYNSDVIFLRKKYISNNRKRFNYPSTSYITIFNTSDYDLILDLLKGHLVNNNKMRVLKIRNILN